MQQENKDPFGLQDSNIDAKYKRIPYEPTFGIMEQLEDNNKAIYEQNMLIDRNQEIKRRAEYPLTPNQAYTVTLPTGRGGLFIQDPTTSRQNVDENGKLLYKS